MSVEVYDIVPLGVELERELPRTLGRYGLVMGSTRLQSEVGAGGRCNNAEVKVLAQILLGFADEDSEAFALQLAFFELQETV